MTTTLDLPSLEAIAKAATAVPMQHVGALYHYRDSFSPSTVLALLERVRDLEAALVEASELYYTTPEARTAGFDPEARLHHLRALAGEGKA